MIFLADEKRADGYYGHNIDAADWAEAESICASLGWTLKGTLEVIIDADTEQVSWDREAADCAVANLLAKADSGEGGR